MNLDTSLIGFGISLAFVALGDLPARWPLGVFGLMLAGFGVADVWGVRLF